MSDTEKTTTERMPWCDDCNAIAVPTDDGVCGVCGAQVSMREGRE